jgi:hypothetical protein
VPIPVPGVLPLLGPYPTLARHCADVNASANACNIALGKSTSVFPASRNLPSRQAASIVEGTVIVILLKSAVSELPLEVDAMTVHVWGTLLSAHPLVDHPLELNSARCPISSAGLPSVWHWVEIDWATEVNDHIPVRLHAPGRLTHTAPNPASPGGPSRSEYARPTFPSTKRSARWATPTSAPDTAST